MQASDQAWQALTGGQFSEGVRAEEGRGDGDATLISKMANHVSHRALSRKLGRASFVLLPAEPASCTHEWFHASPVEGIALLHASDRACVPIWLNELCAPTIASTASVSTMSVKSELFRVTSMTIPPSSR